MPSTIAISIAVRASSSVAGIRSRMSPSAGVLWTNERPRSPVIAPDRNVRYCAHSGLSRPSAAIARSRSIWSACGLIRMSIGLPIAKTPMNTSSDMTNSTTTLCRLRRMMKTSIVWTGPGQAGTSAAQAGPGASGSGARGGRPPRPGSGGARPGLRLRDLRPLSVLAGLNWNASVYSSVRGA